MRATYPAREFRPDAPAHRICELNRIAGKYAHNADARLYARRGQTPPKI